MNVLNLNIGVLGHVDSGKTSLVKALSTALSTAALGPTLPAYAADLVPEAKRGLGLAAFRSAGDVGFVGAPLALGLCADAFGAPAALAGLAGASVASAGAFAVLNRRPSNV